MSHFRPRSGAEFEIQRLLDPVLRDLAARVERKAKANLRKANIGETGKLERSIKAGPVQTGFGRSTVTVRAVRYENGADVAYIIHQGHAVIRPKKAPVLRFVTKDGYFVATTEVRAVGGVEYLAEALNDAARELFAETGGKAWFRVKTGIPFPARQDPKPHTQGAVRIGRRRRR